MLLAPVCRCCRRPSLQQLALWWPPGIPLCLLYASSLPSCRLRWAGQLSAFLSMHTYSRRLRKDPGHCAGKLWHAAWFVAGTGRLSSTGSRHSCHFSALPGVGQGFPAFCLPAAGCLRGKHTAGPHLRFQSSRQSVAALLKVPLVSRAYESKQLQLPARVQFVDPDFLAKCVLRGRLLAPTDHPLQVSPDCFTTNQTVEVPLHLGGPYAVLARRRLPWVQVLFSINSLMLPR